MTTATPTAPSVQASFPFNDFKDAFNTVARAASSRPHQTVLLCVRLDLSPGLAVFTSTNLEIWLVRRLACEYAGPETSVLLTRSTLGEILRVASGKSIELKVAGASLKVTVGSKSWTMPTDNPDYFPAIPSLDLETCHEVDAEWLGTAIKRTLKETRPGVTEGYASSAVQVELAPQFVSLSTSSGKSLAHQKIPASPAGELNWSGPLPLVPDTTIRTLQAILKDVSEPVRIGFPDSSHFQAQAEDTTLRALLVEGKFPSWRPYVAQLPDPTGTAVIGCGSLREALEAAAIALDDESRALVLNFTANELRLSSGSHRGSAVASEAMTWTGPDSEASISPEYLINMLKALGDDTAITIRFYSNNAPIMFVTEDEFLGFVQPLVR